MCFMTYEVCCVGFFVKYLTVVVLEKETCGLMTCGLNN